MRLKFMLRDGHRSVEVLEYTFNAGPPPSISFVRSDGEIEVKTITDDVWITSENGNTIDRIRK